MTGDYPNANVRNLLFQQWQKFNQNILY